MMRMTTAIFGDNNFFSKIIKYIELFFLDLPAFIFRAQKSDVINIQWFSPAPLLFLELWMHKLLLLQGKKIFYTAHNIYPHQKTTSSSRYLSKIYALMDGIFVTTQYSKKQLESDFLFSAPVCVLPHGMMFHNSQNISQQSAKQLLDISSQQKIILLQGMLRPYKGIEFLLRTFSQLISNNSDALLLIAGSGKKEYIKNISALVQELQIPSKNVMLHLRYIAFDELPSYFRAADIVVFPYQHIYQSGALLTAIGLQRAVIATNVGGFPEIIENDVSGKLIEFGNVSQFVHAMSELLSSSEQREVCASNAFQKMNSTYSWKNIAQIATEFYSAILEERFDE